MGFINNFFSKEIKTEERATATATQTDVTSSTVSAVNPEDWFYAGSITEEKIMKIPTVVACLNVLTRNIAKLPIYLAKENKDGSVEKALTDQRVKLLNSKSSAFNSGYKVKENLVKDYVLHGGSYAIADVVLKNGNWELAYLEPVEANRVTITRYTNPKNGRRINAEVKIKMPETENQILPSKDVIYAPHELIICANGYDGLTGQGVLTHGEKIFRKALAELKSSTNYFERNGIPTGLLKIKKRLQEADVEKVKTNFKEKYQGAANGGEVILLQEDADYVPLQPMTLDNTAERESINEEIAKLMGVPYSKVSAKGGNNSKSLEIDNKAFLQECLSPIITVLEEGLDYTLLSEDEKAEGWYFRFDVSEFERASQKENMDTLVAAWNAGFMKLSEVRAKIDLPAPDEEEDGYYRAPGSYSLSGDETTGQNVTTTKTQAVGSGDDSKTEVDIDE